MQLLTPPLKLLSQYNTMGEKIF